MKDISEEAVISRVCVNFHSGSRGHCDGVLSSQLNIQKRCLIEDTTESTPEAKPAPKISPWNLKIVQILFCFVVFIVLFIWILH